MPRPSLTTITSGLFAWDTSVDANFDLFALTPAPIAEFANFAALPTASSYDDCIAITFDTHTLYISDGTNWVRVSEPRHILLTIGDETTTIGTGTPVFTFRMPYAFTVTEVRASLVTASSSGTVDIDVNDGGTTIFSTGLTIDANETTSVTAATPAVISDSALADDAEITIDVDAAGTGAVGLRVMLIGVPA